jgi:CRISPR system Cascade subunit CasD
MSTLLLRLKGPMQSWGVQSRFTVRDTGREPSKSGVVGLLCAALGRPREAPIDDLAGLRMGVRVDQEGRLLRDYHTAGKGGFMRAKGNIERKDLIPSNRYYLADAAFLVGLEGDGALLAQAQAALRDPRWSLYLGRKAFVPGAPVWLPGGLRESGLETTLQTFPWLGSRMDLYEIIRRVRVVLDAADGPETRPDYPVSFAWRHFTPRRVVTDYYPRPPLPEQFKEEAP